jgi:hypothetical protein
LDPTAPLFIDHSPPDDIPASIPSFPSPFPSLTLKVISTGRDESEGRTPSKVVEGTFRFRAATPVLDTAKIPGAVVFDCDTTNAVMWYTVDGSEPTNSPGSTSLGPKRSGESIPLVLQENTLTIKAKAFRNNYLDSAVAISEFSPTNTVPNRITFGFDQGEASSDFLASPGQRFFVPVTLSLLPNAKMYGLQFNLSVGPGASSATSSDYQMAFQSSLIRPRATLPVVPAIFPPFPPTNQSGLLDQGKIYVPIPPATFKGFNTTIITITNITSSGTTNVITFPVSDPIFSGEVNLIETNTSETLLEVGWAERYGQRGIFDSSFQDLIAFSMPHDTLFLSAEGRVVPGIFSFLVPSAAQSADTYTIKIARPSATADGVSQDIFVQAPTNGAIKAVQTVTLGSRPYVVGDIAPFRWFNAGEFGDGGILNNDITQLEEVIAYNVNVPPTGSDMFDAMDTCCISTNGTNLSGTFDPSNGDDLVINQIGYGDGKLDIADLYVAYRRALDPSLVWYARYWTNGTRQAMTVPNTFRGARGLSASPKKGFSARAVVASDVAPGFSLSLFGAEALPGQTVLLPIMAEVTGGLPVTALMFNATIGTLDGGILITEDVQFIPGVELGSPTFQLQNPAKFGGAWLDTSRVNVNGKTQIGTLRIQVPTNATLSAIYQIHLENVSASPNGVSLFPVTTRDAYITMQNRASAPWTDEITDDWRVKYFGSTLNAQSAPDADPDGDGLSNLAEFRAGTSPADASDALKLQVLTVSADGLHLRFPSISGKRYILESCGDLGGTGGWSAISDPIDGTGAVIESPRTVDSNHQFYRVRLAP